MNLGIKKFINFKKNEKLKIKKIAKNQTRKSLLRTISLSVFDA